MAKKTTKENDWSVFLTGLGYKRGNKKHGTVFKKFEDLMTTPGNLASLWEDLGAKEVKDMLSEWVTDADTIATILSGIKDLAPKGKKGDASFVKEIADAVVSYINSFNHMKMVQEYQCLVPSECNLEQLLWHSSTIVFSGKNP